jgi:hypothetical protein
VCADRLAAGFCVREKLGMPKKWSGGRFLGRGFGTCKINALKRSGEKGTRCESRVSLEKDKTDGENALVRYSGFVSDFSLFVARLATLRLAMWSSGKETSGNIRRKQVRCAAADKHVSTVGY